MIRYDFGLISQTADDINATNNSIAGILDDLRADLQPLVAEWEGASADAYNAAQRKWDQSAAELNDVLRQVAQAVREANDRMSEINNNAAQSWA